MAHQDQGPVIFEEDLHALALRISEACPFDGNFTIEGPTDKMQVSAMTTVCLVFQVLLQGFQVQASVLSTHPATERGHWGGPVASMQRLISTEFISA